MATWKWISSSSNCVGNEDTDSTISSSIFTITGLAPLGTERLEDAIGGITSVAEPDGVGFVLDEEEATGLKKI